MRAAWGAWAALSIAQSGFGQVVRVPPGPETAPVPKIVVRGPWGSGPGQFGRTDEASRPGPMDFAVTDAGLYVLDPVNARVQLFAWDGGFRREIPIGTKTADFMTVDEGGRVIVLDAFVRREMRVFSPSGEHVTDTRLPASIDLASAVMTSGEHVYVEERHSQVHEVSLVAGTERTPVVGTLAGRPLRDRRGTVRAVKVGTDRVVMRAERTAEPAEPLTLEYPSPVRAIVGVESDAQGRVYVVTMHPRDPAGEAGKSDLVVAALNPDGSLAGTLVLPDAYVTDHYRKVGASPGGALIQMQTTEDEVRFVRWALPAAAEGRVEP